MSNQFTCEAGDYDSMLALDEQITTNMLAPASNNSALSCMTFPDAIPNLMPGQAKRSLSSMQEGHTDWGSALTMCSSSNTSPSLPYSPYSLTYMDNAGRPNITKSPSIQSQNTSIITPDVNIPGYGYIAHQHQGKRRKASAPDPAPGTPSSKRFPEPVQHTPLPSTKNNMVDLQIGDTSKVLKYYETAFSHFRQANCCLIAKAFIKFIEPRKQARHPYNGGSDRDPATTRPIWWPASVRHKEPDHLKKPERLCLLIHILRNPSNTLDNLKEAAQDIKQQFHPRNSIEILLEIFRVREMEERFQRREVHASTMVNVQNRGVSAPSLNHLSESFMTVNPPAISPFSMCNDRTQAFPLSIDSSSPACLSSWENSQPDEPAPPTNLLPNYPNYRYESPSLLQAQIPMPVIPAGYHNCQPYWNIDTP